MNRLVLFGIVLAAIAAVGSGQMCTPDQWEGYEASFGGYSYYSKPGVITEHNTVHYDAKNKRVASYINYSNNDYKGKFQIVIRYSGNSGNLYYVDLGRDICWVKKLETPFIPACIPESAKKIHEYTMGPAKGGLRVTGYQLERETDGMYMSVVHDGSSIIPVTENVHASFMKVDFVQTIEYAEITTGIKNATVFDIPQRCQTGAVEGPISEFLLRKRFILGM